MKKEDKERLHSAIMTLDGLRVNSVIYKGYESDKVQDKYFVKYSDKNDRSREIVFSGENL